MRNGEAGRLALYNGKSPIYPAAAPRENRSYLSLNLLFMKWLLVLIVLGGLGYAGYTYKDEIQQKIAEFRNPSSDSVAPASAPTAPGAPGAPAHPAYTSKIAEGPAQPGEKHLAPVGTYYMTERVTKATASGIIAVNPAEPVRLMEELPNQKMKVLRGGDVFEVKSSQVTNDLDVAREVEKKDFVAHGGKL